VGAEYDSDTINNGYKNIEVEIRARLDDIKDFKKLIEKFEAKLVASLYM